MKKKTAVIIGIVIVLFFVCFVGIGSGLFKNPSAFISGYSVSDDGTEMTLNIGVGSSVGYIRSVSVHQQMGGKLYLDCYSAFGGINGSIGAKDTFSVPLDEETSVISIYRGNNCYEEVLVKDESGSWQKAAK